MPQRARSLLRWFRNLSGCYALARLLNTQRERRGSIDFDLPEPVIEFDAQVA